MATHTLTLTPALRNPNSEGSLDTSILNGKSIQRTAYIDVYVGGSRKTVERFDGGTFDDTTIQTTLTALAGDVS